VIFDYFYNEILRDPKRTEVQAMLRTARAFGEDYTFGIDRGQVEAFLTQRGFRDVTDMTMEEIKRVYFTGRMPTDGQQQHRHRNGPGWIRM